MIHKILACLLVLCLLTGSPYLWSQKRAIRPADVELKPTRKQALVIGNAEYVLTSRLRNPANDATASGDILKQLGFEVSTLLNA